MFDDIEGSRTNLTEWYPEKGPSDRGYDAAHLALSIFPQGGALAEVFWRGNQWVAALNGGMLPQSNKHQEFADQLLPELKNKGHFVDQMIQDLRGHGLCTAQNITAGMGSQVMTNYGLGFLNFILTPEELVQ